MSVTVEQLPGEPIVIATFGHPFDAYQDVRDMFKAFLPMRSSIQASLVFIIDISVTTDDPHAFGHLVVGMGEAAAQIRVTKADQSLSRPQLIFVGTGEMVTLAADAIGQDQYGGSKARVCARLDEAVTLARTILSE